MRYITAIAVSIGLIGSASAGPTGSPTATFSPSTTEIGGPRGNNKYPDWDLVPQTNDPQVVQWLQAIDLSGVPNIPLSNDGVCPNNFDPNTCWWTCNGCTRATDVVACPQKNTWGLTFDDGPSPYDTYLLNFLSKNKLKATFFIIGSRAAEFPDRVKQDYQEGHQLAVHTWSHHPLTSLTNEEIVAELLWTSQAIYDSAGVYPIFFRPPYGDIDDRVRYIAKQLGMTPVIWGSDYDSNDWQIGSNPKYTKDSVIATMTSWIPGVLKAKTGFISLEHDLDGSTVLVATKVIPLFLAKGIKTMPVADCVGAKPYGTSLLGNSTVPANSTSAAASSVASPPATTGVPTPAASDPAMSGTATAAASSTAAGASLTAAAASASTTSSASNLLPGSSVSLLVSAAVSAAVSYMML